MFASCIHVLLLSKPIVLKLYVLIVIVNILCIIELKTYLGIIVGLIYISYEILWKFSEVILKITTHTLSRTTAIQNYELFYPQYQEP